MATLQFNFTERDLDKWVQAKLQQFTARPGTVPTSGEITAWDRGGSNSVPGLSLRLRLRRKKGAFSLVDPFVGFYLIKKIQGRKRALLIGDRLTHTVEMARGKALSELRNLEQGVDQRAERKKEAAGRKLLKTTYRVTLEDFLAQAHGLRERTVATYRASARLTFAENADKPLLWFTPDRLRKIHRERSEQTPSGADLDFRTFRLVWNWARTEYRNAEGEPVLVGPNPVSLALNKQQRRAGDRGWNNVARRQRVIPESRLGDWFQALYATRNDPASSPVRTRSCDLLEALALTGLRFNELAQLTWTDVDLELGVLKVRDTTSKNRKPLVRTLTRRVREILGEAGSTKWVFPGRQALGPVNKTQSLRDKIWRRSGLQIRPHDLRRTYASGALRAGVPLTALKRLLNHASGTGGGDVTEGYVVTDLESLREYAQTTEDHLLGRAGLLPSGGLDQQLQGLLASLPEDEKRRLLLQLAQGRAQEVG